MSTPELCDSMVRWGLVALIAFTPLAFGTVEPWSIALMEWGIVTLTLLRAFGRLWPSAGPGSGGWKPTGLEVPLILFLLFGLMQTVPLPFDWVRTIAPGSARMREHEPLPIPEGAPDNLESLAASLDPLQEFATPERASISVDPELTRSRVLLLASFVLLFLLVSTSTDSAGGIVFLLGSVTIVGFVVALQGLIQFLTWNGRIFWVRRAPSSSAFGPFVNHNHFAGYIEMVIPVAISMALYLIEQRRRPRPDPTDRWGLDALVRGAGESKGRWGKAGLALFAAVVLVVCLLLSMSRGGFLSALVSGLVLFVLVWRRIGSRWVAWSVAIALPSLVVGLAVWIGLDAVRQHLGSYRTLENEASFRSRAMVWDSMLARLPDFVWAGSGLGAFEPSFAPFAPPGSDRRWDKAHNDYLQVFWEGGVIGSVLLAAGGYIFVRRYWWPAIRAGDHPLDFFRTGIAVSLLSIGLHSLLDFNLQIGANGFLFSLLASLLVSLDRLAQHERMRPAILRPTVETAA